MSSTEITYLIILLVLVILSGFFSSAETALTTVSKVRIRMLVDEGNKAAVILEKIIGDSGKLLSTVLIGNNIVNLTASALATLFAQKVFGNFAVSISTGILTIIVLIFGEVIPKRLATLCTERMSLLYAYPIYFLMIILTPVVFIVEGLASGILRLFKVDPDKKSAQFTENELRTIVDVSHEEGVIETDERQMLANVFDFGDVLAKDIMVPRVNVCMVDINSSPADLIEIFRREKFTRYPVYEETTDNITGTINVKDILLTSADSNDFSIKNYIREPFYTYEQKNIDELFVEMQRKSTSICIVLDEYGVSEGIITMEDILEEIVGDIKDEYDSDEKQPVIKLSENEYLADGALGINDFNDIAGTQLASEEYDSIGGLIMEQLDHLPLEGESVRAYGCLLAVKAVEKNRIEKVLIKTEEGKECDI